MGNQVVAAFSGVPLNFRNAISGKRKGVTTSNFQVFHFSIALSNCELARRSERGPRQPFGELTWNDPTV